MQDAIAWVRANAIPLASVEAGHTFADLEPLRRLIGDARLVSLGESTSTISSGATVMGPGMSATPAFRYRASLITRMSG